MPGFYNNACLIFLKKVISYLPEQLHHFVLPVATCERPSFSVSLSAFGIVTVFYFSCPNRCVVLGIFLLLIPNYYYWLRRCTLLCLILTQLRLLFYSVYILIFLLLLGFRPVSLPLDCIFVKSILLDLAFQVTLTISDFLLAGLIYLYLR